MRKYNPTELTDYDITLGDDWGNEYDYKTIISMIQDRELVYLGEPLTSISDVLFEADQDWYDKTTFMQSEVTVIIGRTSHDKGIPVLAALYLTPKDEV